MFTRLEQFEVAEQLNKIYHNHEKPLLNKSYVFIKALIKIKTIKSFTILNRTAVYTTMTIK